jgi:teichuronic acid biosynthesis glycosyltransferase TuaC
MSQVTRVLFVVPAGSASASMVFAKREIACLRRLGVECETLWLNSRMNPWALAKDWLRLRQAVRLFKPDLVHAHYGTMTAFFAVVGTRVPVLVTYRGSDLNPCADAARFRSLGGRVLSQMAALGAARIICVSEQLKDRLWWRRQRAVVIPTGVETSEFYPRGREVSRAELGWGDERVVLFNAGGNPVIKRQDLAEAAVKVARSICGEIRLVVLDGQIPPSRVPLLMSAADCLLVTSDWEGSPTVVQEAMACDLPVVSVDVGDVRLRLADVRPSRIVARDPEALGQAVVEVLQFGARSNGSQYTRDLSTEAIGRRVIAVYNTALSLSGRAKSVPEWV